MIRSILFLVLFSFLLFCSNPQNPSEIKITGKILTPNVDEIKLILYDAEIAFKDQNYFAEVNEDSTFSFNIKNENPLAGSIYFGRYSHDIFLFPGDDLKIIAKEDTVSYSGKGADRNNFLYEYLEKGGYGNYYSVYGSEKSLEEVADFALEEYEKVNTAINNTPQEYILEPIFNNWLKIESLVEYESFMNYYPLYYRRKNKISRDSLKLPQPFQSVSNLNNYANDTKISSRSYFSSLNNLIYSKAFNIIKNDSIIFKDAVMNILFDTLKGKSRDYVLAYKLDQSFSMNRYDTLYYNRFNEEITNPHAKELVEKSYQKYLTKQKLINAPLNDEFKLTLLVDDKGNELTFIEMLKKYEGKIVYLDIWSLGCAPCIENMPKSKKIKANLQNRPIEFVYITTDIMFSNLWDKVYDVTLIKENHYRFAKGFDARMLKYLEINWVPNYMLFNKDGDLLSYTAVRPDNPNCEEELLKYLN